MVKKVTVNTQKENPRNLARLINQANSDPETTRLIIELSMSGGGLAEWASAYAAILEKSNKPIEILINSSES